MTRRLPGFSLIETVVALFVLAIGLAVLLPGFSRPVQNAGRQLEVAYAEDIARSRLARLGLTSAVQEGVTNGSEADRWIWRETISSVTLPGSATRVYRVTIQIYDPSGRRRLATLEAYR